MIKNLVHKDNPNYRHQIIRNMNFYYTCYSQFYIIYAHYRIYDYIELHLPTSQVVKDNSELIIRYTAYGNINIDLFLYKLEELKSSLQRNTLPVGLFDKKIYSISLKGIIEKRSREKYNKVTVPVFYYCHNTIKDNPENEIKERDNYSKILPFYSFGYNQDVESLQEILDMLRKIRYKGFYINSIIFLREIIIEKAKMYSPEINGEIILMQCKDLPFKSFSVIMKERYFEMKCSYVMMDMDIKDLCSLNSIIGISYYFVGEKIMFYYVYRYEIEYLIYFDIVNIIEDYLKGCNKILFDLLLDARYDSEKKRRNEIGILKKIWNERNIFFNKVFDFIERDDREFYEKVLEKWVFRSRPKYMQFSEALICYGEKPLELAMELIDQLASISVQFKYFTFAESAFFYYKDNIYYNTKIPLCEVFCLDKNSNQPKSVYLKKIHKNLNEYICGIHNYKISLSQIILKPDAFQADMRKFEQPLNILIQRKIISTCNKYNFIIMYESIIKENNKYYLITSEIIIITFDKAALNFSPKHALYYFKILLELIIILSSKLVTLLAIHPQSICFTNNNEMKILIHSPFEMDSIWKAKEVRNGRSSQTALMFSYGRLMYSYIFEDKFRQIKMQAPFVPNGYMINNPEIFKILKGTCLEEKSFKRLKAEEVMSTLEKIDVVNTFVAEII